MNTMVVEHIFNLYRRTEAILKEKKRGSNITAYVATEDSFCMM